MARGGGVLGAEVLVVGAAALLATALVWRSCVRLELACDRLSSHHGVPAVVKGSLLMAASSSFPELATVVVSTTLHGEFELGLAALLGSAIFNVLVIPGAAVAVHPGGLQTNRTLVFREAQFYLIAVLAFFLTLCLAVIYNGSSGPGPHGVLTRALTLLPIGFYGLYLFFQLHEIRDHRPEPPDAPIDVRREWLSLSLGLVLVTVGVEVLVRCALRLGALFDTPSAFWGLTVIAAATSVPDLFLSVRASRRGQAEASLSNVLGSNVFDLLIVVPLGVLIAGDVGVPFLRTIPVMAALLGATVLLVVLMRTRFRLGRRDAAALVALYVLFVLWRAFGAFGAGGSVGD